MAGSLRMFIGIVIISVVVGFAHAGRDIEGKDVYDAHNIGNGKGLGGGGAVGDGKDLLGGTMGGRDPLGEVTGLVTGALGNVEGIVGGVIGGGIPAGDGLGGAGTDGIHGGAAGAQP